MGITVDKVEEGLPISVIVPLSKKRRDFFDNNVFPMLEANNPIEIIVNDNEGGSQKKRNDGFKKSTQPYLFFCDDDIVLPANYLRLLYKTLIENKDNPKIGYSYTGYYGIVIHPNKHPLGGNFTTASISFDGNALKLNNYISTMSLIRREVFPMFDENIKRFQDWDIYLTMLEKGIEGILTPNTFFWAYYLDEGITSNNVDVNEAVFAIRNKHNLW
jgi:glycosyltransferase involved in cell wall biosynthesis